jgi:DNA-binding transcriptional ArsR family regulator
LNVTDLDAVLSALSDPTRREIIDRLVLGPLRVTDLAEPLPISLAAVSKHIQVLEKAGLVRRSRQGREHVLTLDAAPIREVARWASQYERYWDTRLDRLEAHFKEKRKGS